jgi:hypothetical protein
MKQGCPFYISFTSLESNPNKYRCSGIHALHKCDIDPNTWDRYARYRTDNSLLQSNAVMLMSNGLRSGQATSVLNTQYNTRIQPRDVHRIVQMNRQQNKSLNETLSSSETQ